MTIHVLLLIDTLSLGGAEYQVVTDANLLAGQGLQVVVGFFGDGPLRERLSAGVNPVLLKQAGWLGQVLAVRRLCRDERVDLIQTHMWRANAVGSLAGRSLGIPVIVTEHGMELWRRSKHTWVARLSYRLASRIVAVCEATRQVRIRRDRIAPDRIDVMYNCFDPIHGVGRAQPNTEGLRRSLGISPGTPVIGFIGRLHPVKRLDLLVEIAAIVCEACPNTVFLLVGDGPARGEVESLLLQKGLADRFRLPGYRSAIADYLALMDLLVMTSEREGLPVVILEASACGIPAVAFDVGGVSEAIDHGKTGFVVPFGDLVEFSRQVLRLLSEQALRAEMGRQARLRAGARFSPEARLSSLVAAYRALVGEQRL